MDLNTAIRLCGTEGSDALLMASSMPREAHTRIERLARVYGSELARAVVLQTDLRHRAKNKFQHADKMLFTREALEQSSGDACASWRALQYHLEHSIIDGCCGIGGDLIQLPQRGPVLAVDVDPVRVRLANHNAGLLPTPFAVQLAAGDVMRSVRPNAFILLDPSRRQDGKRNRRLEGLTPSWSACLELASASRGAAIKLSPALSTEELDSLPGSVEVVSLDGVCRETICWLGNIGPEARRTASILPAKATFCGQPSLVSPCRPELGPLMFEPDPALIASRLLGAFAIALELNSVSIGSQFLTGDQPVNTPFLTTFRVIEILSSHVLTIRKYLRSKGLRVDSVKTKGIDIEPEKFLKEIGRLDGHPVTVIITTIQEKRCAIICDRVRVG